MFPRISIWVSVRLSVCLLASKRNRRKRRFQPGKLLWSYIDPFRTHLLAHPGLFYLFDIFLHTMIIHYPFLQPCEWKHGFFAWYGIVVNIDVHNIQDDDCFNEYDGWACPETFRSPPQLRAKNWYFSMWQWPIRKFAIRAYPHWQLSQQKQNKL